MLRITVHHQPQNLTFQLEGKLSAASLRELEDCWKSTLAQPHKPNLCIDLAGVIFIDDAGKACLTAMHRQGAELIAADCAANALVAEITQTMAPDFGCRSCD